MTILWLGANVILRFLTGDPPETAAACSRLFSRAEKGELTLRVLQVVIAEVVWVLVRFYKLPKQAVCRQLASFTAMPGVEVKDLDLVLDALFAMAERNVDFVDALLAATARKNSQAVASLDRDFDRLGVTRIDPMAQEA